MYFNKRHLISDSGQSFLTAYLIIFLFSNTSIPFVFLSYHFRLGQVLSLFLFCIASPFLFRVICDFFCKAPWWLGLFTLLLLLHPFILIFLTLTKIYSLPSGYGPLNIIISNISWTMLFIATIVLFQSFSISNYHKFFLLLFWIILAISIESLISYILFKLPYCIATPTGEFEGGIFKIRSDTIARFGILLIPISITMALLSKHKHSKVYLAAIPLAVILIMTTMNRSAYGSLALTIIGLISYIIIFLPSEKSKTGVLGRIIIAGIIFVIVISALLVFSSKYRKGFYVLDTLWSRTVTWTRGLEIGVNYFPIGVSGLSAKLNGDENIPFDFPPKLIKLTGDPSGEQQHKINTLSFNLKGLKSHSLHSVHVALFANFGLFGLAIIVFLIYIPLSFLCTVLTLPLSQRKEPIILCASFFSITLLALQPALFMESTHDILWIIFACIFYIMKVKKSIASFKSTELMDPSLQGIRMSSPA